MAKGGGSGWPGLHHIQWEKCTDRPGSKVWYAPQGNHAPRHTKTYLGYVGQKLAAEWEALDTDARATAVREWVTSKLAGKGVAYE